MRITLKGQVTIPADIREQAGLLPHTEIAFDFDGQVVRLTPVAAKRGDVPPAYFFFCATGAPGRSFKLG